MNIGILIICTGKYSIFFESLYESCEKFFLKDHKKTYYVFTESEISNNANVVKIHQQHSTFPNDTLKRFHMFNSIKDKLCEEDYVFFLNANMLCIDLIGDEIFPNESHGGLMAVQHPGFEGRPINEYTYERNLNSNFYIPYGDGIYYYQGNFNGGRSGDFLRMSELLAGLIDDDESKGIIPIWWDESAMNWYLKNKTPLMVSKQYASPEGWNIPNTKIMNRDKNKFGGHTYLRY